MCPMPPVCMAVYTQVSYFLALVGLMQLEVVPRKIKKSADSSPSSLEFPGVLQGAKTQSQGRCTLPKGVLCDI